MRTGIIYKIESPTKKVYIGKTLDFSSRMSAYRTLKCNDQKAIYNSLQKHGFDSHTITIIYEGPSDTLSEKEIKYIQQYNSFKPNNPKGLNLTRGGDGQLGNKQSEETIKKRAMKLVGTRRSDKTKQLMSESAKKRGSNFTGKKHSKEALIKMSEVKKGKVYSPSVIELRKQTTKQNRLKIFGKIIQMNTTGEVLREWDPSFVEIAKELGCDPSTIRRAVKSNGVNVSLGYKWKYSKK